MSMTKFLFFGVLKNRTAAVSFRNNSYPGNLQGFVVSLAGRANN